MTASAHSPPRWRLSDRTLRLDRVLATGIVNVTEDSFYPGARSGTPQQAISDGVNLAEAGFDMLDVGALAARSGRAVDPQDEAGPLVEAIEGLVRRVDLPISADTFSASVAERALGAGAVAINDIGGGSPEMLDLVASTGGGLVLMHIEGPPRVHREPRVYDDPVDHLKRWFSERAEQALDRGVDEQQLALDPGLDFDLGVRDGLELLRRLGELDDLGRPLYVSLSRKDFLGAVLAGSWEGRVPAEGREWATCSAAGLAVAGGAGVMRLHDRSALQAVRVAEAIGG